MFVCPHCQAENRATAKFCRRCGKARSELTALAKSAPAERVELELPAEDPAKQRKLLANQNDLEQANEISPTSPSPDTAPEYEYVPPECPSCFTALRAVDKFCSWCGEPQPNRLFPHMKVCPDCQQLLPERANYCSACGRDIGMLPRLRLRLPTELFKEEEAEFFPTFDA